MLRIPEGVIKAALLPHYHPDRRMEGFTKINTYIYHGINTGPIGTFVGVSLAAVKTSVILHLKQYYSLGWCVSSAYVGAIFFLLWCQNNWEWYYFIYMNTSPINFLFRVICDM